MGDPKDYTKKSTDWLGHEIEEHFNVDGEKIGETRFTTDIWGKPVQDHYNSSGEKVGETTRDTDWLGKDLAQHTNADGTKTGFSRNETDLLGRPVQRHYEQSGEPVGSSRQTTDWSGRPRKEHEGEFFKARDQPSASDPSVHAEYSNESSVPSRSSPGNHGPKVLSVLALLAAGTIGTAMLVQHFSRAPQAAPARHRKPVVAVPVPNPPTARIEGIAYSYSKEQWAWTDQTYGSHYPAVRRLGFFNWLQWGAAVSWKGSHIITQNSLSLSIRDLALPTGIELQNASTFHVLDQWSDVGVGYYVELRRATFDDLTLSKHILFFRTFVGDTPPPTIEKTFPLHPVPLAAVSLQLAGQWVGVYKDKVDEIPFVMRITQDGNTLSGSAMDYGAQKRRASIFGYLIGTRVTLLKRFADTPYAVSLVSSEGTTDQLEGAWHVGNSEGRWNVTREGAIDGTVDDLPVTPPTLPRPSATASVSSEGEVSGSSEPATGGIPSTDELSEAPVPDRPNQVKDARLLLRFRFSLRTGRVMAWLDNSEIFRQEFRFGADSSERLVESGTLLVTAGRHRLRLWIQGAAPPSNGYTWLEYTAGPGEEQTVTARLRGQGLRQRLYIDLDQ